MVERLLRVETVAEILQIGRTQIYALIAQQTLDSVAVVALCPLAMTRRAVATAPVKESAYRRRLHSRLFGVDLPFVQAWGPA